MVISILGERTQNFSFRPMIPVKGPVCAGAEFIDENGGGPGVRLRKPSQGK